MARSVTLTGVPGLPCARCGGRAPMPRGGIPRLSSRYCSAACRLAAVRERRASARAELVPTIEELRVALERLNGLLKALGLPRSVRLDDCARACEPAKEAKKG